jgi:hypothetical protein
MPGTVAMLVSGREIAGHALITNIGEVAGAVPEHVAGWTPVALSSRPWGGVRAAGPVHGRVPEKTEAATPGAHPLARPGGGWVHLLDVRAIPHASGRTAGSRVVLMREESEC